MDDRDQSYRAKTDTSIGCLLICMGIAIGVALPTYELDITPQAILMGVMAGFLLAGPFLVLRGVVLSARERRGEHLSELSIASDDDALRCEVDDGQLHSVQAQQDAAAIAKRIQRRTLSIESASAAAPPPPAARSRASRARAPVRFDPGGTLSIDSTLSAGGALSAGDRAQHSRAQSGSLLDSVDCTAFAPPEARAGGTVMLQVFLHLPEAAQEAVALAMEFDREASRRGVTALGEAPRGARYTFVLSLKEVEIDEPVQELVWRGRTDSVQFGIDLPEDCRPTLLGTVRVMRDQVPVGHLRFKLEVVEGDPGPAPPTPTPLRRYRYAFVSYAVQDRPEVLRRVQMLPMLGIRFFQDVLDLEPGDRWEERIYEHIDRADVFFLFWSRAASESEMVRKEIRYALSRKDGAEDNPPEIWPVPIEHPMAPPPPELSHLHFNDRVLYFLESQ